MGRLARCLWAGLALAALTCCFHSASIEMPERPGQVPYPFAKAEPSPEERARFQRAADYSREHFGFEVLVIQGDHLVFEEHQNGSSASAAHHVFSGTKSFSCPLAVTAGMDGKLSLDERVADTLPGFGADERKARITVRELLNFTSGLAPGFRELSLDAFRLFPRIRDRNAFAVTLPAEHEPGAKYVYGSQHLFVLSALLTRKLGEDPLAFLERRVLEPIGLRYGMWMRDGAGNAALPYGAYLTARDWARFGVLIRDRGTFQGRALLDPARLAECFQGSSVMPAYGLTFWLNRPVPPQAREQAELPSILKRAHNPLVPSAPPDLVVAAGLKDNRLYIVPSLGMVVVRLADGGGDWSDEEFMARLLGKTPVP
jgi:CubicO group peptidase (beta-lactamase class C family)